MAQAAPPAPPRPACDRAIACGAVSSVVIPAERSESRDPRTPAVPFLTPGYLGPGSSADFTGIALKHDNPTRQPINRQATGFAVTIVAEDACRVAGRLSDPAPFVERRAALMTPRDVPRTEQEPGHVYHRKPKMELTREPSSHLVFPIALMTSVLPFGIERLISPALTMSSCSSRK